MIKEIGVPLGSGTPDQRRDCVDDQSKAIFGFLDFVESLLQFLLGFVLLGDIQMRTDQFDHFALAVDDRMPHGMYALDRSVGKSYPKINFKGRFLSDRAGRRFDVADPVFRNNTIPEGLQRHSTLFRIEPENVVNSGRPIHELSTAHIPGPAARTTQLLRFG